MDDDQRRDNGMTQRRKVLANVNGSINRSPTATRSIPIFRT